MSPRPKLFQITIAACASNIAHNLNKALYYHHILKSEALTQYADQTYSTANMADSSEVKPKASEPTEPKPAESETKLANDPAVSEEGSGSKETLKTEGTSSVVGMASNAASSASAAALGVKDSVFSMFGGGAKKEKKVEEEDEDAKNEPSGSSKAQKADADAEEVCIYLLLYHWHLSLWPF